MADSGFRTIFFPFSRDWRSICLKFANFASTAIFPCLLTLYRLVLYYFDRNFHHDFICTLIEIMEEEFRERANDAIYERRVGKPDNQPGPEWWTPPLPFPSPSNEELALNVQSLPMRLQIVGRIQSPTVNYQTATDEWKLRKVEAVGRNLKWLCKFTRPVVGSLIISSLNEVERSNFHFLIPLASTLPPLSRRCDRFIAVWTLVSKSLVYWKI